MGEEAQNALSHTQTCVFILYTKATKAVIKVSHANTHIVSSVGHHRQPKGVIDATVTITMSLEPFTH